MCFIDNAREVQGAVVLIALQRYDILKARWRALADIGGFRQFFFRLTNLPCIELRFSSLSLAQRKFQRDIPPTKAFPQGKDATAPPVALLNRYARPIKGSAWLFIYQFHNRRR